MNNINLNNSNASLYRGSTVSQPAANASTQSAAANGIELTEFKQQLEVDMMQPEQVNDLDSKIKNSLAQVDEPAASCLTELGSDCDQIVAEATAQLAATSDSQQQEHITSRALTSIVASATGAVNHLSQLETQLALPFSIISMQVLTSATKIMASQSDLAVKKMEAMTKLIEQLQALTTLMTEITNQLNKTYTNTAQQKANSGDTTGDANQNTINWNDIVTNGHGQTKRVEVYDLSYMIGSHGAFDPSHFKDDPLGKFLIDHGYVSLKYDSLCGCGNSIDVTDKAKNSGIMTADGRLYVDKLPADEKQEFLNAFNWTKNNDNSHYDDWAKNYKHTYEFTKFPDYYDSNGKKIASDDPSLNNAIIFDADSVPESIRKLISPLTSLYNSGGTHTGQEPTQYAISAEAIQGAFKKLTASYSNIMGETPDDFTSKLANGITGTVKDIDNISKILQQKIQYIQQKQAALAKTPENAKEDGNRKLDMFNNILQSTRY